MERRNNLRNLRFEKIESRNNLIESKNNYMKNLLIIGASGFGRDIYDMAIESIGYGTDFQIKGFLDIDVDALKDYPYYPNVISSEDDYQIQEDDVFVCALGDVHLKKKVTEKMLNRGAEFHTLIHKTAHVSPSAIIGKGCIIEYSVYIGSYACVDCHCLIQNFAIIGHDVKIGSYTRLDGNVLCVGGVKIGNNVILHSASVINHKVVVKDNAIVGACSFVIRNVKEGTTVCGNPAILL